MIILHFHLLSSICDGDGDGDGDGMGMGMARAMALAMEMEMATAMEMALAMEMATAMVIGMIIQMVIVIRDRKCWDPCAPITWDNSVIFRTTSAILTTYQRKSTHMSWVLAPILSCCKIKWRELRDSSCGFFTAIAWNKAGNNNQGSEM